MGNSIKMQFITEGILTSKILNVKHEHFVHSGLRNGFIMEIREVTSMGVREMIIYVGGMLGLFVCCTLMTFVQLILFFSNYIFEKLERQKARQQLM